MPWVPITVIACETTHEALPGPLHWAIMSWMRDLFVRSPHADVVVIPHDLAQSLRQQGGSLQESVVTLLRRQLQLDAAPPETVDEAPFWVGREQSPELADAGLELEDALRDRVNQRRAAETER